MKSYISNNAPEFTAINLGLTPFDAFALAKGIIEEEDANATVSIDVNNLILSWNSRILLTPIKVSVFDEADGTKKLWIESANRDADLALKVTKKIDEAQAELTSDTDLVIEDRKEPSSAIEVLEELMADPAWSSCVTVLPSAIKGAEESVFANLKQLKTYLLRLASFAAARRTRRGTTNEAIAEENGLGGVYRRAVSFTAETKYAEDYIARWNGAARIFGEHLTVGFSVNNARCFSAHFLFDQHSGKIVIGRMGKHGECTRSNS
jgi:hypothetical protein